MRKVLVSLSYLSYKTLLHRLVNVSKVIFKVKEAIKSKLESAKEELKEISSNISHAITTPTNLNSNKKKDT